MSGTSEVTCNTEHGVFQPPMHGDTPLVALRLVCASVAQAIGAWRHSTTLPLAHKEIQNAKIQHYLLFRQKPALARGVPSQ